MIKPKFSLALLVFFSHLPFFGFSQQNQYTEISTGIYSGNFLKDTAAIINCLKMADALAETHTDSALALARHAVESSQRLQYRSGVATGLYYCGILYQIKGSYPPAINTLLSALPYCNITEKNNELKIKVLSSLADVYFYYGKADSTAFYCYQALDEIARLHVKNVTILVETYTQITRFWLNLNDNPMDLEHDKYMQNAIGYLNKAELLQITNNILKARILISKGQMKQLLKDYDSARYFFYGYLQLIKQGDIDKDRSGSWGSAMLLNISEIFLQQKRPDSAAWYARAAIAQLPPNGGQLFTHFIFAQYYLSKALCMQKRYNEAITIILPALAAARQKKVFLLQDMAHQILAEAYRETGKFDKALEHQTAYSAIKDSLMRTEKIQAISQMEMRYQVAEKNKEIAVKELDIIKKDNSIRAKNLWIGSISIGLLLVLSVSLLAYRTIRHRQQVTALRATQQLEFAKLKAAIDGEEKERGRLARELHDGIGGQLGSMRMQLDTALRKHAVNDDQGDFAGLLQQLDNTYTELRKTAHNLMPETLILEGLIKAIALFCTGISKGTGIEVIFQAVGDIPQLTPAEELALYRIVQELVHNIVKHARANKAMVQLGFAANILGISVEDNGVGFMESNRKEGGDRGMGLHSIRDRIKALGGNIDISSRQGMGTSIHIEIENVNFSDANKTP